MADGLVVVDTDLLIDFLRGSEPGASMVERWLVADTLRVTAVSAFELRLGADFMPRAAEIGSLLSHRTLPLDLPGSLRAGEVFAQLAVRGAGIGLRDAMIAGVCLRFELPLATRNRRHFDRVAGLRLVS